VHETDTIFALSSGTGRSGVAVVRISGSKARKVLGHFNVTEPEERKISSAKIVNPFNGNVLDYCLVIVFLAPRSYTGEDVVEFHLHGGTGVVKGVLDSLADIDGLRLAEPGEFTKRAFLSGKLDLTQAEAIADLIDAQTQAQVSNALNQMTGSLKIRCSAWRSEIISILARLEALIDFPEDDLPEKLQLEITKQIERLLVDINNVLNKSQSLDVLRNGLSVGIIGPPNSGKSSFLNLLAEREAAIVSEIPGTTRDVIEVHLEIDGNLVILSDTAGLRNTPDKIESEGVSRAISTAKSADLLIAIFDGSYYPELDSKTKNLISNDTLVAVNKADLLDQNREEEHIFDTSLDRIHFISVKSGFGINNFLDSITKKVNMICDFSSDSLLSRIRHKTCLTECKESLEMSLTSDTIDLIAEDVRNALRSLGRITGNVDIDELLDAIFKDFCIGK